MDPQPTTVPPPVHIQIADDLRLRIARGELAPGDELPTLRQLATTWGCSIGSARAAIALLKQQGLITGGRGRAPHVRAPMRRVVRDNSRHQQEKDLVLRPEEERRRTGTTEMDMGVPIDELHFRATYDRIEADADLADVFGIDPGSEVLRRIYETSDPATGHRHLWSVSYIPVALISSNATLLDETREPWPGGTQHQLYTVGIEIDRMVDEVTATMPTTADVQLWGLEQGVPLLRVRHLSIDIHDRVVEMSESIYPADRTTFRFTTPLTRWS